MMGLVTVWIVITIIKINIIIILIKKKKQLSMPNASDETIHRDELFFDEISTVV